MPHLRPCGEWQVISRAAAGSSIADVSNGFLWGIRRSGPACRLRAVISGLSNLVERQIQRGSVICRGPNRCPIHGGYPPVLQDENCRANNPHHIGHDPHGSCVFAKINPVPLIWAAISLARPWAGLTSPSRFRTATAARRPSAQCRVSRPRPVHPGQGQTTQAPDQPGTNSWARDTPHSRKLGLLKKQLIATTNYLKRFKTRSAVVLQLPLIRFDRL